MFSFLSGPKIEPLTVKDVLVALLSHGRTASNTLQPDFISTITGFKQQIAERFKIPKQALELQKESEFLEKEFSRFKRNYGKNYKNWMVQISIREGNKKALQDAVRTVRQLVWPKVVEHQDRIWQVEYVAQKIISDIRENRKSLSLLQKHHLQKMNKINRLSTVKANISKLQQVLKQVIGDEQLLKLIKISTTQVANFPANISLIKTSILHLSAKLGGLQQDQQQFTNLIIKLLNSKIKAMIACVQTRVVQAMRLMPRDYGSLIKSYYLLKDELRKKELDNIPQIIQDTLSGYQGKDLTHFIRESQKFMDNWQILNRWHLTHKADQLQDFLLFSQKLGSDLIQQRKIVWKKIQDRLIKVLKTDMDMQQALQSIQQCQSIVQKSKVFCKGSGNAIDKVLKQVYDKQLDCFIESQNKNLARWKSCQLKDYKRINFVDKRAEAVLKLIKGGEQKLLTVDQSILVEVRGQIDYLYKSMLNHLKVIALYPHASQRIWQQWLTSVQSTIFHTVMQSVPQSLDLRRKEQVSRYKKIDLKDLDKVVPILDDIRLFALAKRNYPRLAQSQFEGNRVMLLQSLLKLLLSNKKQLYQSLLTFGYDCSSNIENTIAMIQESKLIIQQAKYLSLLERQFPITDSFINYNNGKRTGNFKAQTFSKYFSNPIFSRLFAQQCLVAFSAQDKGGEANRTAMQKEGVEIGRRIGEESQKYIQRMLDLWQVKDLSEIVKSIKELRLKYPLRCYTGVDRMFIANKKQMQLRATEAFVQFLQEQLKK